MMCIYIDVLYEFNVRYVEVYEKEIANSQEYRERISYYNQFLRYMERISGIPYNSNILHYSAWTYYIIKIHVSGVYSYLY